VSCRSRSSTATAHVASPPPRSIAARTGGPSQLRAARSRSNTPISSR
jgi:hypothetical protein